MELIIRENKKQLAVKEFSTIPAIGSEIKVNNKKYIISSFVIGDGKKILEVK